MANPVEEEFEDSEEDDEDYVPGEEESDEDISDAEPEDELEQDAPNPEHANGTSKKKKKLKGKKKPFRSRGLGNLFSDEDKNGTEVEEKTNANGVVTEVEEKDRVNSLWADFLSDVTPPPKKKTVAKVEGESDTKSVAKSLQQTPSSSKIKVTELFEFAGETVEVTKEVDVNSQEAANILSPSTPKSNILTTPGSVKRSGGAESILGRISAKKNRLSTLEKTKLDWNKFKEEEGIDEDLKVHNKGKDGYLEKMDFLQRADLRQFEVEKSLRLSNRTNRQ